MSILRPAGPVAMWPEPVPRLGVPELVRARGGRGNDLVAVNLSNTRCDSSGTDPDQPGRTAILITDTDRTALADELLAVRCQLGHPGAIDALVDRWNPMLWRYVHRMVGDSDEAADTLQDVWLRILRALPSLKEPGRIRPWMFGIARRALMDRLRRSYARPMSEELDAANIGGPEAERDLTDDLEEMQKELTKLPAVEREVLVLFYLEDLPLAQVAQILAIPEGTVKSRLFRARRTLRDQLERKERTDD